MNLRFYTCDVCGKTIAVLNGEGIPTKCCGEVMKEIIPNKVDATLEKHVPVFFIKDNIVKVKVGSDPHPMTEKHLITWIGIQTDKGFQFKELKPEDEPKACFMISPQECVTGVYAFCNLHGLWFSDKETCHE